MKSYFNLLAWTVVFPFVVMLCITPSIAGFVSVEALLVFGGFLVLNVFLFIPYLLQARFKYSYFASIISIVIASIMEADHVLLFSETMYYRLAGFLSVLILSFSIVSIRSELKSEALQYSCQADQNDIVIYEQ